MRISDWSSDVCSSDLVLTIDGPSGSGKGTISRALAARLGWHYLDSGALYRAVGLAAAWADIDLSDADALLRCTEEVRVQFREAADPAAEPRVLVNGRSEEHTSELQSLMRISYAVFCLNKKNI